MANFIPSFHFDNPEDKLKPQWASKVKNYYYFNTGRFNLLKGKKLELIDQYWTGDIDMLPFKRMFKSMRKRLDSMSTRNPDGTPTNMAKQLDTVGLDWDDPLALLPAIMNSAVANIQKIPVTATCKAQDALAMKKEKEDIEFLKNKPEMENDLQEVASQLGIGKVDLGPTKHSAIEFNEAPAGLDLNDPEQEAIFSQLFYSLKVVTAFEKALAQVYDVKRIDNVVRKLLNEDQFKYGVACVNTFNSAITGLPDVEYIHPSRCELPNSDLPDFSDNNYRVIDYMMTVEEMFNQFGNEICDQETLEKIINGGGNGYCSCNGINNQDAKNFSTFKVNLKHIQVKSIDWVGVKKKKRSKAGHLSFTMNEKECDSKIWAQNTYSFFWLLNTDYYFRIERLDYSFRERGNEAFQTFPSSIYRSQKKSATELSIASNRKAIIADLKLQHALIKSLPPGKYIDLRFLRNALKGLKNENSAYTIDDLLALVFENNQFIGDTEGFDGKNDGQMKPFMDIPGGLKTEVTGYLQTILSCSDTISTLVTGINKNLTGQSAEELVGLQELKINSGLNAIDYCNQATKYVMESLYNVWGSLIQKSIETGGKVKDGVINMIGINDVNILDSLNEAPLHTLTIKVEVGQRFYEMQAFNAQLNFLKSKGVIGTAEEYLLSGIENPREKMQKLYVMEARFKKEQQQQQQAIMANQQAIAQQNNQTVLQQQQMKGDQDIKKIYAQGDVDAKLEQLASRLGLTSQQIQGIIDRQLQKERNDGQTEKGIRTIKAKQNADVQSALV